YNDPAAHCEGLSARLAEVDRGERDLTSALGEYQADLLDRGNAAVEHGKEALKRFVPSQPQEAP
ncbi:MAG TPA: hypothetical protein VM347_02690, partial [Nonomuraea sp.]|nr:hypothetical protein [Nonomuraea sp.]